MATRKKTEIRNQKTEEVNALELPKVETKKVPSGKWIGFGWVLLLIGGLAHMLPEQMAPILKWGLFGISVQLAVGVVSVILALNFLLEE